MAKPNQVVPSKIPTENTQSSNVPHGIVEGSIEWYAWAYDNCKILSKYLRDAQIAASILITNHVRYEVAGSKLGVPWWVLGLIHWREASCDFTRCQHNGERIIGTGRKTTKVPAGRGPFATWEASAVDALKGEAITRITDWTLENVLNKLELYNGPGYLKFHGPGSVNPQRACYLWSYTDMVYSHGGRYTYDHKFDVSADPHDYSGIVPIMKILEEKQIVKFTRKLDVHPA